MRTPLNSTTENMFQNLCPTCAAYTVLTNRECYSNWCYHHFTELFGSIYCPSVKILKLVVLRIHWCSRSGSPISPCMTSCCAFFATPASTAQAERAFTHRPSGLVQWTVNSLDLTVKYWVAYLHLRGNGTLCCYECKSRFVEVTLHIKMHRRPLLFNLFVIDNRYL